jgi:hypothetical protein
MSYVSQVARCTLSMQSSQWPDNRLTSNLLIFKHLANLTMKFTILAVAAVLSTASAFGVPVSYLVCLSFAPSDPSFT